MDSISTAVPTSLQGSDDGTNISLSWGIPAAIPTGWWNRICMDKASFMLNGSEEVCEDLASGGDPASTEVSQCIGSECSSRDV